MEELNRRVFILYPAPRAFQLMPGPEHHAELSMVRHPSLWRMCHLPPMQVASDSAAVLVCLQSEGTGLHL